MSVYCRLASPPVFLRALHTVAVSRDGWATVAFTDSHVVLHVEGTDENMTATCTMPKSLFAEYAVVETRFAVHIPTLIDALLMLGPSVATASMRAVLAYPADDAKLLVELTPTERSAGGAFTGGVVTTQAEPSRGGARMLQSLLVTRNVRDHLLDLRFAQTPLLAQVTLQGDMVRELIADVAAAQCSEVSIRIDAKLGVVLRGEGGPYGQVESHIHADSEALLSLSRERSAETRVYSHHLALACGARGAAGGAGASSGATGGAGAGGGGRMRGGVAGGGGGARDGRLSSAEYMLMGLSTSSASGAGGAGGGAAAGALFGGFERLTLQINAQRQLSVLHTQRDHELKVSVAVVVLPLSSVYDLL
ncbi:Cell cycle checkpoint protein RAD1-like [Novymonas esmeraldas]|uniref:Cell cycle checkpoint protein RAD1-like n=1 Tax=Novymonas esmeraldas TaxID=1808958 RepID=A0AAW0FAJ8_9TRYP